METHIHIKIEKYSLWEIIKPHLIGFSMLFFFPFIYGYNILKKIRINKEPELRPTNLWIKDEGFKGFDVWTYAIDDEKECERLFNSLDFPDWAIIDPFRFILKIKTEPNLELLNGSFFDENMLQTEKGIFLFRINKKGFGMTLCFLDVLNRNFTEITKLKSLSWEIKHRNNTLIELVGYDKKEKHIIQIKNWLQHRIL